MGVKDDGSIVGVDDEKIESIKKDFVTTINNPQKFSPPLYLNIETVEIQNKKILYIHVPTSTSVHTLNGKIFDRNNDSDINITGQNANIAKLYLFKQDTHTEDKIFPYATHDFGCIVEVYDPWADPNDVKHEYNLELLKKVDTSKYEAIILTVAHDEFRILEKSLKSNIQDKIVYDVKGFFSRDIVD